MTYDDDFHNISIVIKHGGGLAILCLYIWLQSKNNEDPSLIASVKVFFSISSFMNKQQAHEISVQDKSC